MKSQNTVETRDIDRVGKLSVLRVIDLDKLAETHRANGAVPVEHLQTAGEHFVEIALNKRGAEPTLVKVASAAEGVAYLDGFQAAIDLKKKGPRKKNGAAPAKPKKKR